MLERDQRLQWLQHAMALQLSKRAAGWSVEMKRATADGGMPCARVAHVRGRWPAPTLPRKLHTLWRVATGLRRVADAWGYVIAVTCQTLLSVFLLEFGHVRCSLICYC